MTGDLYGGRGRLLDFQPRELGSNPQPVHFYFLSDSSSPVERGAMIPRLQHWDALHARFLTKRIDHSKAYSTEEANTNQAESFFSRLRRAEIGIHHHVAGPYLSAYASEMAWRENNRRVSNGAVFDDYSCCSAASHIQKMEG